MAQNTAEVRLGAPDTTGGYAKRAPLGSTRPTGSAGPLVTAYVDLGYLSEDGVEVATENGVEKIKDWNLDTIATVQESNECTLTFTLMQKSVATAKAVFGEDNVEVDTDPTKLKAIHYTGGILPHEQFAFLMKDGSGAQILDIGDGQITGMSGFTLRKNQVISFKVTVECFRDANGRFFTLHGA